MAHLPTNIVAVKVFPVGVRDQECVHNERRGKPRENANIVTRACECWLIASGSEDSFIRRGLSNGLGRCVFLVPAHPARSSTRDHAYHFASPGSVGDRGIYLGNL